MGPTRYPIPVEAGLPGLPDASRVTAAGVDEAKIRWRTWRDSNPYILFRRLVLPYFARVRGHSYPFTAASPS